LLAVSSCPVLLATLLEMLAVLGKCPPHFGNAHRALEMLTVLGKCPPRFGNARRSLEMLSSSAR